MTPTTSRPRISIIVNFYNMRREAERTLYSLSSGYQKGVDPKDYEVIAIDNGSTEPLDEDWVTSFGNNFKYVYFNAESPSPCAAMNYAMDLAGTEFITCCIDGARILSPGILRNSLAATRLPKNAFIYTLGMHIGHKPQNYLIEEGYNQQIEDDLLKSVDWHNNGYELFNISSVALSSKEGFFSELSESNCFTIRKSDFVESGGFDERFTSPGGGLINLDIFNRIHKDMKYSPIMLLGEATFHQFHGGVATNVEMENHPWEKMNDEFKNIRGKPFKPVYRSPEYYGFISAEYHSSLIDLPPKLSP